MVPNGWEHVRLNNLCLTVTSGSRDWAKYYAEQGSKFIRMTNLQRDNIYLNLSDLKFVDVKSDSSDGKRTSLKAGDILMSITAELGKIGWVHEGLGEAFINQHTALIRLDEKKSHSKYIAYLLSSKAMNHKINRLNDSGAKAGLNLPTIRSIPIDVPPLPEQRKIAKILSTWDKAISATERLIDNSKQQKKALMQQLLTGKKRLLDDSGKPFDGEWEDTTIESTSKCFSGGTPSRSKEEYYGGQIPWITSGKLNDRFILDVNEYITELGLENSSAKVVKKGSILIAMYGATAGKVAINKLDNATINQAILALETKSHCHNLFMFYLLDVQMQRALNLVQGGQPNLSAAIIKTIKIRLPSLLEQKKIASVLSNADKEIELLEQQLADLKQEKKALMQQLLTGKRRVKI
ncbi:restriction endonuclease subunit S [Thalassotalea sediminis]|uniref:restriction endonuclease subunit S n=1 Tax=Thalassotalea sediminis TaxID=1759089 RepID=UPI002573315E|nr:restriction endonuclease subunit S [Thalassotalea sediminis]